MKKIFTILSLMMLGIGCVMAQLPYNTTLTENHFNNSSTVVAKESANWDSGIRLGTTSNWSPGNWDDHYVVIALNQQSIPYQLKFKYKVNSAISSNPNWYVAESADNSTWSNIWTNESRNTSWSDEQTLTLSKSTKYIKLCFSGNYSGTFANISVTDQAYVNNPKVGDNVISSLNFGTGTISSGKAELSFDIEWCNVNALSVTSDNEEYFSVSPASFGGKAQYGTQTITVTYDRDKEVNDHTGTITISNGTQTKTVSVSGSTTKRTQAITWNAELAATNFTLNAEDELTGAEVATADNEEAEITFSSDNEDVIAVSPDGKTLYAVDNGTANITVTATGNDIYYEGTDSKLFTVTALKKQTITWDQNFMGLKTNADPKTIELTATATSGGEIIYSLEDGSDNCVTLNGATMTITGTPGIAYIIATQEGGLIGEEEWIAASARKQVKVRDPNSDCDEYALADQSFTFAKGDKTTLAEKEFTLVGKPTKLTFTAKWGGKKYSWSEQQDMMIEQYANFGSGLEWKQVASFPIGQNSASYGPYALDETATKIRFRSGEYGEQNVSNISVPRKKEMVVSESAIDENAERNVKWSKTISVSRSNIDVVDIFVESTDPNCPFEVSKTSIGTDCADRNTETFDVYFTPREKDSVYTGTITITDGKAKPTTHVISLNIKSVGFNQSISDFVLPAECLTTDEVELETPTATSGLEVVFLSSDSTIAYVEENKLVILKAGTVDIIAYQAGDDRYNEARLAKTIEIKLTPIEVLEAPEGSQIAYGAKLGLSELTGGSASVEGTFVWTNPELVPEVGTAAYAVTFVPTLSDIYATANSEAYVEVISDFVEQEIIWDDDIVELALDETAELHAFATSDLAIAYISSDSTIAYVNAEGVLLPIAVGDVTITATQAGNGLYLPAEPVDMFISIYKKDALEVPVELSFCESEGFVEYRGEIYDATMTDYIDAPGALRDTVFVVNVEMLVATSSEEYKTIQYGAEETWNEQDLSQYTVGNHELTFNTENAAGCDSTATLYLTVEKLETLEVEVELFFCEEGFVEYRDQLYTEEGADRIEAEGATRDTVYVVTITELKKSLVESNETLTEGEYLTVEEGEWYKTSESEPNPQLIEPGQYEMTEVGSFDLTLTTTNVAGCDSVVVRHITVEAKPGGGSAIDQTKVETPAVKEFRNGAIYIRRGDAIYGIDGKRVE